MAQSGKLKQIADERNEPLEVIVPRQIEKAGSIFQAAVDLGVQPNALQQWLKRHGLKVVTRQVASVIPDVKQRTTEDEELSLAHKTD
jgi:hypothetical protein